MKINKAKPILYLILVLSTILIYWIINSNNKELRSKSINVNAKIEYIRCQTGTKGARSLIKVNYDDNIYNLHITKGKCKQLKKGDSIELLYSKEKDKFFFDN